MVCKLNGWINLNKPPGITSNQAIKIIQKILKVKKIGHSGTLDEFASGVLPVAINEATKSIPFFINNEKEYIFKIQWSQHTSTTDQKGEIIKKTIFYPTNKHLSLVIFMYKKYEKQIPPVYSNIKFEGKKSYKLASNGNINLNLQPKNIRVEELTFFNQTSSYKLICSKGTYIRSFCRDVALNLGTFAHINFLKRTKVKNFYSYNTISLEKIKEMGHKIVSSPAFYSIYKSLKGIPKLLVRKGLERRVYQGKNILTGLKSYDTILAVNNKMQVLGIGLIQNNIFQPKRIFKVIGDN